VVLLREWSRRELAGARLSSESARELARALSGTGVLDVAELVDGVRLASYSWVGRLQLGDLTVTIEPKIAIDDLLALVRYAYGLRDLRRFDPSWFSRGSRLLQDLLAAQLHAEVSELMRRGLHRAYVTRSDWLTSPRGRLDMNALALRSEATSALPCRHHPRSRNHMLHGVVLSGLGLAAHLCASPDLRRDLRRLATQLGHEIDPVPLDAASIRAAWRAMNRLVAAYEPALRLIEILYGSQTASFEGARALTLPGFLFDMNRFFQALVGRLLRENLPGCRVMEERSLREMMGFVPGKNPQGRRPPRPRPDFAVERNGERILLDAKYRDLWETPLPRSMLYQLAIYALSREGRATAAIVYPAASPSATEAVIEIRDPSGDGALGYVALRPLILADLAAAIRDDDASRLHQLAVRATSGDAA
jgi:5-methylcytosine-specific restriction enzyme subunit McrC